jgi:hypothetical protein
MEHIVTAHADHIAKLKAVKKPVLAIVGELFAKADLQTASPVSEAVSSVQSSA